MTFDKQKVMRSAERYLMQGKIRAAIDEYVVIVQQDSKDINTLNMLGDLYARVDDKAEAVKCFTNVAEYYDKQGFSQKAIAVYNKISRLIPDSIAVSEKLAPLYHQKGSLAEARTHYKIIADDYQKKGKKIEALNILRKIAELDPYNTDICLKLADSYLQENYKEEALSAFIEAGNRFVAKRNFESAITVFSRALEINTLDWVALNGYVSSHISLGNSIEAAERLEELHNENPYNTDVMLLLADCYIDLNNLKSAERVLIELVAKEPANYLKLVELVYANLKVNDLNSAVRVLNVVAEHLLVGGKNDEYKKIVDEFLTRDAEHTGALRLLVRYYTWLQDQAQIKATLERLALSAKTNDLIEDERYALSQLITISPHETQHSERLSEIGGVIKTETANMGIFAQAEHLPVNGVPSFENFQQLSGDNDTTASFDNNNYAQDFAFSQTNQTEFESSNPTELSNDQLINQTNESNDLTVSNEFSEPESIHQTTDGSDFDFSNSITSFEDGIYSAEESSIVDSAPQDLVNENTVESLSPSLQAHLQQELESVEFYISSGYYDLAKESLDSLERQFGPRPEIKSFREDILTHTTSAVEGLTSEINSENPHNVEEQQFSENSLNQELVSNQVSENFSEETVDTSVFAEETVENTVAEVEYKTDSFESQTEYLENDDSIEISNYNKDNQPSESDDKGFEFSNVVATEKEEADAEIIDQEIQAEAAETIISNQSSVEFEKVDSLSADADSKEIVSESLDEYVTKTETVSENSFESNYELPSDVETEVEEKFEENQADQESTDRYHTQELSVNEDIHKTQDSVEEVEAINAVSENNLTQNLAESDKVSSEKFNETNSVETDSKLEQSSEQLSFEDGFLDQAVGNVVEKFAVENVKNEPISTGFEGFDDFRNSLGLEESEEDNYSADYETHYNLAIAYKEMGLHDDAVKEFQDAVKLVKANDGTRRHLQCCHLLGHCFMEKNMPKLALIWFEKGLETSDLNSEEKQAIFYEIACAHESDGEKENAFRFFEQIYAVDVEYRDVAQKIRDLG